MTHQRSLFLLSLFLFSLFLSSLQSKKIYDEGDEEDFEAPFEEQTVSPSRGRRAQSDDFFDDEEFVGIDSPVEPKAPPTQQKPASEKKAPEPKKETTKKVKELPRKPKTWMDYQVEIAYVAFLVVYLINFLFGRYRNSLIAEAWDKQFGYLVHKNYFQVGEEEVKKDASISVNATAAIRADDEEDKSDDASEETEEDFRDKRILVKETENMYKFTAIGRRYSIGITGVLELKKRQELISMFYSILFPSFDKLTMDIVIQPDSMESFVFALIRKRDEERLKTDYKELKEFCTSRSVPFLSNKFVLLSDNPDELIDHFLYADVVQTLETYSDYVDQIYITDQFTGSPNYKKVLRFVFFVPPVNEMDKLATLMKMSFHFIDLIGYFDLSKQAKSKANSLRQKQLEAIQKSAFLQRQEEAQKRKLEKRQKEQERILALSPEKQREIEEKEHKKLMKKKSQMRTKVILG